MGIEKQAIDLFSGAGGLSSGLHMAGWDVIAGFEFDKEAVATYEKNFPDSKIHNCDVREVDFTKFKGIGLVAGGPPCQPFSVAGKQLAENDPRDMVPQFIRAVREAKPKAFLMENVAGLMTAKHKPYLEKAAGELEALGYSVSLQLLSSYDYGVPQKRQRVFLVGTPKDSIFHFPLPSHGESCEFSHITAREVIATTPEDEPNRAKVTYAKKPVLRPSPFAGMLVNGQGRPINLDGPCHTISASAGGNRTHIVDVDGILKKYHEELQNGGAVRSGEVEGVRRLTVKESAAIQSFPTSFEFIGKRSAQYRQIGNAVPPLLAKAVSKAIFDHCFCPSIKQNTPQKGTFSVSRDMLGRAFLLEAC